MGRPLCLVGMSGIGKSHASRLLAARGWTWHDCDRAIAARLGEIVRPEADEEPVHALGRWMGMPWTAGYREREQKYLALEAAVTEAVLDAVLELGLEAGVEAVQTALSTRHVVDTTGSVIYLPPALLARLRQACTVIYLQASDADRAALLDLYLHEPKPVVWAGAYGHREGEPHEASLRRSYPALLDQRHARYLALAHRVLPAAELRAATDPVAVLIGVPSV
jgi:shikimate kinase